MSNSTQGVYMSDGPDMSRAVKVSGRKGAGAARASSSASRAESGTSSEMPGTGNHTPEQSMIQDVAIGGMPVVNKLNVVKNSDGSMGINVSVADSTPMTSPGVSSRRSSSPSDFGPGVVKMQPGWNLIGNGYKYYVEGTGFKTGWHSEDQADGTKTWYYLDEDPLNKEWMVTGWKKITGKRGTYWYYFRPDGKMSIYWEVLNGMWYYLEPQDDGGNMVMGWKEINGNWYYFIPEKDAGYMMINWLEINGKWYYFYNSDDKRGIMAADHMANHTDGKQYYLGSDGAMVTKADKTHITYNGTTYEVGEDGACSKVSGNSDNIPNKYKHYYTNNANLISQITTIDTNKFAGDINNIKKIYTDNKGIYESISDETGVPPKLIAAIHYRESNCNFNTYLHNGQTLGKPTTIEPKGKLFYDFKSAAVDALNGEQNSKNFYLTPDADMITMMTFAEIYNGIGYTKYKGIASPYVYSGTNVYTSGKYVSDGKYNPNAVDKQPGVYLLVATLLEM